MQVREITWCVGKLGYGVVGVLVSGQVRLIENVLEVRVVVVEPVLIAVG